MYTVYILQDDKNNLYKGMTNNLDRRVNEHKNGKTRTTRKMENIRIIYTEEFDNFGEARKREIYFKSAAGRRFLKNKIWLGSSVGYPPERLISFSRAGSVALAINMYTVYILQDDKNNLYKGMTNNLDRRVNEHKNGKTRTTRKMENIRIIYTEEFDNFGEARKREIYFKSAAGRRFLKNKIWLGSSVG